MDSYKSNKEIKNIKYYNEGNKIRITFDWPVGVQQVKFQAVRESACKLKLFTLQEYKKHGGYITEKIYGKTDYYIYPYDPGKIQTSADLSADFTDFAKFTIINKIKIYYTLAEKFSAGYKKYTLTVSSPHPVPPDIICYVKKKNSPPVDINDGTLYYLEEEISQPLKRIIRTDINEHISVFAICDELFDTILK